MVASTGQHEQGAAPEAHNAAPLSFEWPAANQTHLRAALDLVRARLGQGSEAAEEVARAQEALAQAAQQMPAPAALDLLCAGFRLSPFERDLLLLCAGAELDAAFGPLLAAAQGDPARTFPTASLALAALPEAHWSALTPAGTLRRWRLIEVSSGPALMSSPLRIDERVLHYLLGVNYLDDRLRGLIEPAPPPAALAPSQQALAERIARLWSQPSGERPPAVQLAGGDPTDRAAVAATACGWLDLELFALDAHSLPADPREQEALMRLWEREATLSRAALLLDCESLDQGDTARTLAAARFADGVGSLVIISGRERLRLRTRLLVSLEAGRPGPHERRSLWEQALGARAAGLDGRLDALAAQFRLGAPAIRAAAADTAATPDEALGEHLWEACRVQARPRLDELAQRIDVRAGWDDLVLPEPQLQTLRDLIGQVRQRERVYEEWGYATKNSRGLGISALFAGVSGTGKTLAAEVVAATLRLDLYRIDLSQVVSKYIGETEKNLRRVFDAAEDGAAVLLFDEADALFGKRSEVKDSHDRYANIEVSYLLQRMEAYGGLAILTTNLKDALDTAFLRRLRFVVTFPFPDAAQRAEIWRRSFPPHAPSEGVDLRRLARLNVAGGGIRTIALNAAFLAADAGEPLRMAHLLRAAQIEYAKQEKPLSASEVGDWI